MAGNALYGATGHDVRDFPGMYLGNVCGLRTALQIGGGGGLVMRPVCIPGSAYDEAFLAPGSGEFVAWALVQEAITGTSATLFIEIGGRVLGTLDLTTLVPGVPTELVLDEAKAELGETVITVRTECSGDVDPGADLSVMFAGKEGDGMEILAMLLGFGMKVFERPEPPPP